ncbi:hypothetical protein V4R08_08650 [Nitrobacter sp. NHB1]|uniref:hypothetical protein n=1 Tax=Nitrobacter sp. NHB1 TaxID=3119830 RepID=UPI002FFFB349
MAPPPRRPATPAEGHPAVRGTRIEGAAAIDLRRWFGPTEKREIMWIKQAGVFAVLTAFAATNASAGVIDDAKASVRLHLFIPDSAKFSQLHPRGDYICGTVEAKTTAGEYAAPKVMIYNTKTQFSTIVDGSQISKLMTDTMKRDLDNACS